VLAGTVVLDYAHSRSGVRGNISYPWGGMDLDPYLERGIGKIII
jgi:hypothetical protein